MFKKELGISIYPEKFTIEKTKKYLESAMKLGIVNVFASLIHHGNIISDEIKLKYMEICQYAKKLGFYIIMDINKTALEAFGHTIKKMDGWKEMGISCLRLDAPLMPNDVAELSYSKYDFDLQINISNNDHFIDNILDFKPVKSKLSGCHNFYPLKNTAMSENFFIESTSRFVKGGIHTSAFVGSQFGNAGPQGQEVGSLVTIEKHRELSPRAAAKQLFASELISTVFVGNQEMTNEEMMEFSETKNINKIQLDVKIEGKLSKLEMDILNYDNHYRRGDLTEHFIRSTMTRVDFAGKQIVPNNTKQIFNRGDVVIINNNNKHYQCELLLVLNDNFTDLKNTVNFIGKVEKCDIDLLNYIGAWNKFEFRIIE